MVVYTRIVLCIIQVCMYSFKTCIFFFLLLLYWLQTIATVLYVNKLNYKGKKKIERNLPSSSSWVKLVGSVKKMRGLEEKKKRFSLLCKNTKTSFGLLQLPAFNLYVRFNRSKNQLRCGSFDDFFLFLFRTPLCTF